MVVNFPSDGSCIVDKMTWGQQRQDVLFRSPFGAQSIEASPALWIASITAPANLENTSGPWQALMMKIRGQTNQLALWNLGRPQPLGTMRGNMVLTSSVAQGATSLSITTDSGQAFHTLKTGDMLGIGSGVNQQVVMCSADSIASSMGVITATFEPPLRNAFSSGTVVTWDKPCALFRRSDSKASWDYSGVVSSGFSLNLIEDWRP